MIEVRYGEKIGHTLEEGSIFLAGPTPRLAKVPSWRPEAIELLAQFGFKGHVFIPEHATAQGENAPKLVVEDLWEWEQQALECAHVIAFWVPREKAAMPGLTTNIEFGMWMMSGKVVFGAPSGAEDVGYMRYVCEKQGIPSSHTLTGVLHRAVMLNEEFRLGRVRTDKRASTPLAASGRA